MLGHLLLGSPFAMPGPQPKRYHSYGDKEYDARRAARQSVIDATKRDAHRYMLKRQAERERNGFYEGTPSVASALQAQGSGRKYRRVRVDIGKRSGGNLVRVW